MGNLEVFKAEHRKHTRATRSPSVALKSSTSNAKRTKRMLTVSPNWPPSYNKRQRPTRNRSKKPKKLLLLIWQNIEKPNKSWRKQKTGLEWRKDSQLLHVKQEVFSR